MRARVTGRCARQASPRCTPATPTSSTPTPPRTGCACWRRSTSRTVPGMVRAAAATMFFGKTADDLVDGRRQADRRHRGDVAGVGRSRPRARCRRDLRGRAARRDGRPRAVVAGRRAADDRPGAHDPAAAGGRAPRALQPARAARLAAGRSAKSEAAQRNAARRLDSDAAAVQIMTVWVAKGLQFPVVYLPFAFNRNVQSRELVLFHDGDQRCLHVGGSDSPDFNAVAVLGRKEDASDDSRLTYVAMTRAQSQVVAWWAPSYDEPNGGLSRLLRGRRPGEAAVPDRCVPGQDQRRRRDGAVPGVGGGGRPVIEESVLRPVPTLPADEPRTDLDARHFHRSIDTSWRRTSYSGLIRAAETTPVSSEPEVDRAGRRGRRDSADDDRRSGRTCRRRWRICRWARSSARWCTRCWRRPTRSPPIWPPSWRRRSASTRCGGRSTSRRPSLAAAMVPMHDTPLGPLADGLTLRQIGLQDRMREMDFEFPLAGGDLRAAAPDIRLSRCRRAAAGAPAARTTRWRRTPIG